MLVADALAHIWPQDISNYHYEEELSAIEDCQYKYIERLQLLYGYYHDDLSVLGSIVQYKWFLPRIKFRAVFFFCLSYTYTY